MSHLCLFVAFQLSLHDNGPVGLCNYKHSVFLYPRSSCGFYPHMAIDARPRVPARLFLAVYMYHESIVSFYI